MNSLEINICLLEASGSSELLQFIAGKILCDEWQGNIETRTKKMSEDRDMKCWIIMNSINDEVYGYGELEISATSSDITTSACPNGILTSFIIRDDLRCKGVGSEALRLFEDMAKNRGFGYLYLWTVTAVSFYRKLGYHYCEPMNGNRSVLKALDDTSISKIEALFRSKATTAEVESKDIWLRKRIIPRIGCFRELDWIEFEGHIRDSLASYQASNYICHYHRVPWCRQIGPSCGLVSLLMSTIFLSNSDCPMSRATAELLNESILSRAIASGYTNDGEMYHIDNMVGLCRIVSDLQHSVCIRGRVASTIDSTVDDVINALANKELILIPYDRDDVGSLPCMKQGAKAHYAIIIGYAVPNRHGSESWIQEFTSSISHDILSDTIDGDPYLIAIHSLSTRPVIAPMSVWMRSNQQLVCEGKLTAIELLSAMSPGLVSRMIVIGREEGNGVQ